jgi:hypothetical protein
MTTKNDSRAPPPTTAPQAQTLADVLAIIERSPTLSPTRKRDLRSAATRVADLLGNVPGRIALDLPTISARLAAVNPVAAGMTTKRFANIRSDFLAAVKASGLLPIRSWRKCPQTGASGALPLRALRERPGHQPRGGQQCDCRGVYRRDSRAVAPRRAELAPSTDYADLE